MLGSVFNDPRTMADAIYKVGMNLVNGKNITFYKKDRFLVLYIGNMFFLLYN